MRDVAHGVGRPSVPRVLVVEEDFGVAGLVRHALSRDGGADVEVVGTEQAALESVRFGSPDLVVVDVSEPDMGRLELCRRLRASRHGADVPIIVTSGRLSEADLVLALDLGADDCLAKPFGIQEFAARARALTRRRAPAPRESTVYEGAHLFADFARLAITVGGRPVALTRRELLLLQCLIANRNRVLSRDQLIERLWPADQSVEARTIDVHMRRVRAKLGLAARQIETVFGVGYRFVDAG